MDWKVGLEPGWLGKSADKAARKVIQCRAQIVDRITDMIASSCGIGSLGR
jgi:hypothetical protein